MIKNIKEQLLAIADENYKLFHSRLANTNYEILGVRTPDLKALAKRLAGESRLSDLSNSYAANGGNLLFSTYEELTLFGLVVAYKKIELKDKFLHINSFIAANDNWASNDIVTAAIKNKSDEYFNFLCSLINKGEWQTRFAVTSFLSNFLDNEHLTPIFDRLCTINYGSYYVDMAVAWFLSIAYIKQQERTMDFLNRANLPEFVLRKTISKICDSLRVESEEKISLKSWLKEKLC